MLKFECKSFLSKLKNLNTNNVGIDDELIKILYELTLLIDDLYSRNEMSAVVRDENAAQTNGIEAKGSQLKCHVCNVNVFS